METHERDLLSLKEKGKMRNRSNLFYKVFGRERGAVFLETALVMPVFIVMLCFCIDFPRIMTIQQRLVGANRLVAEIKARNDGDLDSVIKEADIKNYFFKGMKYCSTPKVWTVSNKGSCLWNLTQTFKNFLGNIGTKITGVIAGILSGGTLSSYFSDLIEADMFFGGYVTVDVNTILPPGVYRSWVGSSTRFAKTDSLRVGSRYVCYMPNCDGFVLHGTSWIGSVKNFFKGWTQKKEKVKVQQEQKSEKKKKKKK